MSRSDPPKVGFLVHDFPVYSETFVAELARGLVGAGCDLRILALDGRAPRSGEWPGLEDRARYPPRLPRLPGAGARLSGFAGHTWMFARQPRFDVMHCQFAMAGLQALPHIRTGALRTRSLVVHLRGYDISTFVAERGPRVYDPIFRKANLLIANCAYFRDRAVALGCPEDKLVVIGSPIDTDLFAPPAGREPPRGRTARLVAVGRLVEKKGFEDAIGAMARLRAESRDVTLDILGDGPLRERLAAQISRLGLDGSTKLHGAADPGQVVAALHAADVALTPSVTAANGDADAAVNTAKEAMATGLPVIGTRHGGIPELVIPGVNGDLVPERDPEALARAIARMLDAPESWPVLGAAGRRKVVTEYDRAAIVRQTLDAYESSLNRAGDRV